MGAFFMNGSLDRKLKCEKISSSSEKLATPKIKVNLNLNHFQTRNKNRLHREKNINIDLFKLFSSNSILLLLPI